MIPSNWTWDDEMQLRLTMLLLVSIKAAICVVVWVVRRVCAIREQRRRWRDALRGDQP